MERDRNTLTEREKEILSRLSDVAKYIKNLTDKYDGTSRVIVPGEKTDMQDLLGPAVSGLMAMQLTTEELGIYMNTLSGFLKSHKVAEHASLANQLGNHLANHNKGL